MGPTKYMAPDDEPRGGAQTGDVTMDAASDDPLDACRRECESLRNENLRIIAESRNQQQRATREKQEALKFAEWELARDLLVVVDDLERTREAAGTAQDVQIVADGVRIVFDHLLKILRERQIEPIAVAVGAAFDPTWHEALMKQPSDRVPDGHVLKEVGRGFKMRDRTLRPAKVIISSGPAR